MQCCVPNCSSNKLINVKAENSGVTYHQSMPMTASERQQKYMDRMKRDDPEKYEAKRKNHLEKVKARQKKVAELTKNNKIKQRIYWRNANKKRSQKGELSTLKEELRKSKHRGAALYMKKIKLETTDTEEHTEKMSETNIIICRICLRSDRKVYNMGENNIAEQYEFLTAGKDCLGDVLPKHICWECKARLASFARLRSVALRSLQLLQEFYETVNTEATGDKQLIIDRDTNNLTPTLVRNNIEIVDYPPRHRMMVVLSKKTDNTVSLNRENRNDNYKSLIVPKVLSNVRKRTQVISGNDNSNFIVSLKKRSKVPIVFSEGRQSTKASIVLNKENKSTEVKNENDNSDYDNENDNSNLKHDYFKDEDETASQKSDDVNYNSGLEDMIYDSDSSESENDDIINEVNTNLAKISQLFDENKFAFIKRCINNDFIKDLNGGNVVEDNLRVNKEVKETFDIKELSNNEQLNEFQQRKDTKNYKNARFKCDICYRGFVREEAFNLHQIKHTAVDGPSKCPVCSIHFRSSVVVRRHIKYAHQYRFSCNRCEFVTGSSITAKLHLKFHKGTIYKCSQCDKTFQKPTSLLGHIRIHHPSDIVCRLCGYSFVNNAGLHLHTRLKHKLDSLEVPEDGPRCDECDIQFSTDAALTTHYQESNKHKDMSRVIKKPADPRRHKGPINCQICDVEFPNYGKYRRHVKESHPDRCAAMLEEHEPIKKYSCDECDKQFNVKQSLKYHKDKHSNRKYCCDICGNGFSNISNLNRHVIVHNNLKFDCNICGKSFNTPHSRKNHITYMHLKKPWPVRKDRGQKKREKTINCD